MSHRRGVHRVAAQRGGAAAVGQGVAQQGVHGQAVQGLFRAVHPLGHHGAGGDIAAHVGYDVAIVDINDLEGQILGASSKAVNKKLYARILKDNPLGQDDQQTPMGIIRRVD